MALETVFPRRYPGERVIVLANREPFRHDRTPDGRIVVGRSASGLVTAVEPVIEACGGVWVAHGAGSADRLVVDGRNGLNVPPANPLYRLRRVWLEEGEQRRYYYGFSNEGLWPLCHAVHVQPVFRSDDFTTYRSVNARFADAACDEARTESPLVLVQDYHFALAPRMIRDRLPRSTIVTFWHIPWPHPRAFRVCPWDRQLLQGLLGSNIIGFQTHADCRNFLDTVEDVLDVDVDRLQDVVTYGGHRTMVRAYPVGVEWPNRYVQDAPTIDACRQAVRRKLGLRHDVRLGIGVDRLDYTKGLNEKCLAVESLLDRYPEFRNQFVFVQIAEPSRDCLPAYRAARAQLRDTIARINGRFGNDGCCPLVLLEAHYEVSEIYTFLRAADLCYVGSLDDGMNLVAKEFVCARDDNRGVLVLSQFAGAAGQLTTALHVNPYAIDHTADTLIEALRMRDGEQASRMRAMREVVAKFNTAWWAERMLQDAAACRGSDSVPVVRTSRPEARARWQACG